MIIFQKLGQKQAQDVYNMAKRFFKENPRRRVAHTDLFKIRRAHIKEDILERSLDEVELVYM